ncbi:hypothetical protein [Leifsonia xyli]|uniref:hypothetical protein n=1 Tax=Leifsonia xyli TaxID=1575 RepID=UPI0012FE0AF1
MTDQQPKHPRWLAARTEMGALITGIGYTVLFILFVLIAVGGGSSWNVLLGILCAVLAAVEWATYVYWRRHRG